MSEEGAPWERENHTVPRVQKVPHIIMHRAIALAPTDRHSAQIQPDVQAAHAQLQLIPQRGLLAARVVDVRHGRPGPRRVVAAPVPVQVGPHAADAVVRERLVRVRQVDFAEPKIVRQTRQPVRPVFRQVQRARGLEAPPLRHVLVVAVGGGQRVHAPLVPSSGEDPAWIPEPGERRVPGVGIAG